jgi:hypothetical protein
MFRLLQGYHRPGGSEEITDIPSEKKAQVRSIVKTVTLLCDCDGQRLRFYSLPQICSQTQALVKLP